MPGVFSEFEIPAGYTLTTGSEEELEILKRRDLFFARVIGHLGLMAIHEPFIRRETRALSIVSEALMPGESMRRSDNWQHELHVCDEAVALVLDRRNGFNYHQVSFMVGEPSGFLVERIRYIKSVLIDDKTTQNPS